MDVVLEDDESRPQILATGEIRSLGGRMRLPGIHERGIPEDILEGLVGLLASDHTRGDLPVVGIKFASGRGVAPHDGDET